MLAALWTIACHAAVASHGSLQAAIRNFAILGAIAASVGLFVRSRARLPASVPALAPAATRSGSQQRSIWIVRIAGGLLGLTALLAYLATDNVLLLWWSAVGVLTFALVSGAFVELQPRRDSPPSSGMAPEAVLWGMGVACTLIALSFHRPDYDSAFYVSIAVGAADHPAAPLMMDTIQG